MRGRRRSVALGIVTIAVLCGLAAIAANFGILSRANRDAVGRFVAPADTVQAATVRLVVKHTPKPPTKPTHGTTASTSHAPTTVTEHPTSKPTVSTAATRTDAGATTTTAPATSGSDLAARSTSTTTRRSLPTVTDTTESVDHTPAHDS